MPLEDNHISQKLVLRTKHFVKGKINPDPDLSYREKESANQFLLSSLSRYSNSVNMSILDMRQTKYIFIYCNQKFTTHQS